MFSSQILDVAIGLAVMFFFQSILVSGIHEAIGSLLTARGRTLKRQLAVVMGYTDENAASYFNRFVNSPFIASLMRRKKFPSYISCANFSDAVVETFTRDNYSTDVLFEKIKQGMDTLPDSDFKKVIKHKLEQAEGNAEAFKTSLEEWFTSYMDQVSAWYRRRTKIAIFLCSLIITFALNVDAFRVMNELWKNAKVRESIVHLAEDIASDQMKSLTLSEGTDTLQAAIAKIQTGYQNLHILNYPITWEYEFAVQSNNNTKMLKNMSVSDRLAWTLRQLTLEKVLGFLITALAASIGAPIWYDLIKKLLNAREAATQC